jgi:3-isopropylmalate/(R)-2-methylmalate dehydratase small subunit
MQKFSKLTGVAAPLMRDNVDTDAIIPGSQLLFVGKSGFGDGLFAEWRYDEATRESRKEDPDFLLNREPYREATILLAGVNFACGSSREPAVWALRDFGIRCIIAESYGHIFYASCFKNGLLPVTLPLEQVEEIARQVDDSQGRNQVTVDLIESTVIAPDGKRFGFEVADMYRNALLEGLDAISATLRYKDRFDEYRQRDVVKRPWIYL